VHKQTCISFMGCDLYWHTTISSRSPC